MAKIGNDIAQGTAVVPDKIQSSKQLDSHNITACSYQRKQIKHTKTGMKAAVKCPI